MARAMTAQTRRERLAANALASRVADALKDEGVGDVEILPGVGWDGRPYVKIMCIREGLDDALRSFDLDVDVRNVCTIVRG